MDCNQCLVGVLQWDTGGEVGHLLILPTHCNYSGGQKMFQTASELISVSQFDSVE